MKIFAILPFIALTASAQYNPLYNGAKQIQLQTFLKRQDQHGIHSVSAVEVVSKVEGNKKCLNDEATCDKKYNFDSILLKVTGMGEANYKTYDHVAVEEKTLLSDGNGKRITEIQFRGFHRNLDKTLVYDNMGWLSWGGQIPYDFKIYIENNLNYPIEEREFRIPLFEGGIYRFAVKYANERWTLIPLPPLTNRVQFGGAEAQRLYAAIFGMDGDFAQATLACLKARGQTSPTCFAQGFDNSKQVSKEIASDILDRLEKASGVFSTHFDVEVRCDSPNEWNQMKETVCRLN